MKKIMTSVAICAALSIGAAHAQGLVGVDGTAVQAAVAQANTAMEQIDALKKADPATKATQAEDANTRLLTDILNTQIQTLVTLKAIEAKIK
ncbi:MAG: hypothetical protein VB131_06730 [Burkholderia gladioli]